MSATPFAIVSTEDHTKIVAYGLDIDLPSGQDVITYRREADGRTTFGVHRSTESAQRRYGYLTPVELVWQPVGGTCSCQ